MTDRPNTTDGGAAPRAEASQAESELDKLLKGFDEGTKPEKPTEPNVKLVKELEPVINFAKSRMESEQVAAYQADVEKATKFLKGLDETKDVPDRIVRGFLKDYADDDQSFANAFRSRRTDPKGWDAKLTEAQKAFAEELKALPLNRVKTDITAARAAVSGEKQPAEPVADFEKKASTLTDSEFYAWRKQLLAEARGN